MDIEAIFVAILAGGGIAGIISAIGAIRAEKAKLARDREISNLQACHELLNDLQERVAQLEAKNERLAEQLYAVLATRRSEDEKRISEIARLSAENKSLLRRVEQLERLLKQEQTARKDLQAQLNQVNGLANGDRGGDADV